MGESRAIRTLIVDDSAVFREVLFAFLEQLPNLEVVGWAVNGNEALDRIATLSPQLVLMDLEMPDMDGLQAVALIRQLHPSIRVIILTVHDSDNVRTICLVEGAHEFVPKNRLYKELPEAIRSLFPDGTGNEIGEGEAVGSDEPPKKLVDRPCRSASNRRHVSNESDTGEEI
jgi:DNA-binding NarL/FixJ family response regulator